MISLKKSLFASAVAVALITTAGNVDGYDVMSSESTYNMKRTLRVAAEEVAEEEMADDSECESLDMAEDKTKTNGGDSGGNGTPVSSGNAQESSPTQAEETNENKDGGGGNAQESSPTQVEETNENKDGGGGDAKEKDNDDSECDSLEMADTDSEPTLKTLTIKKANTKDAGDKKADTKDAGEAQPPSKNEGDGGKNLPPASSGSGNNKEKYDGKTSDIEFNAVQDEVNPGTVVPQ
ncbi:unnamed protein product [Peronospora destructor]|uniref:Uncharacterized protein n=1 Tax=Peronospora destructor TaxID=86335 RepID=A0AAV0SXC2_9STRA|nr:unnamed protein product [Peronospora destructor]